MTVISQRKWLSYHYGISSEGPFPITAVQNVAMALHSDVHTLARFYIGLNLLSGTVFGSIVHFVVVDMTTYFQDMYTHISWGTYKMRRRLRILVRILYVVRFRTFALRILYVPYILHALLVSKACWMYLVVPIYA